MGKKALTCGFVFRFDSRAMLRTLARLRGSALRGRALARVMFIAMLATNIAFAASEKTSSADAETFKPFNQMNLKLYLHNQIDDWDQFDCAVQLAQKESGWRYWAKNKDSGAYGLFQSMSDYAPEWSPFEQIDKHIIYIASRYDGSWCAALSHLERQGWH